MTPQQMVEVATELAAKRHRHLDIRGNQLGNLVVYDGDNWIAWVDRRDAEIHWVEEPPL